MCLDCYSVVLRNVPEYQINGISADKIFIHSRQEVKVLCIIKPSTEGHSINLKEIRDCFSQAIRSRMDVPEMDFNIAISNSSLEHSNCISLGVN